MALSDKTVSKHNLKRAEVFAQNGLCEMDVAFAHPAFVGHATEETDCCLCGHRHIKWLFAIRFDAPDMVSMIGKIDTGIEREEAVTLAHVGSKCITDWLDAVPESAAKLEVLKRWEREVGRMRDAQKQMVCENLCTEAGFEGCEGAHVAYTRALETLGGTWAAVRVVGREPVTFLNRHARKILRGASSRPTIKTWLGHLATALTCAQNAPAPVAPVATTAAPAPATPAPAPAPGSNAALVERADTVIAAGCPGMVAWRADALRDIRRKVGIFRRFASEKQRKFLVALVVEGEKALAPVAPVEAPVEAPVAAPVAAAPFTSPSGIPGARY